jgi:hypothetical protein
MVVSNDVVATGPGKKVSEAFPIAQIYVPFGD